MDPDFVFNINCDSIVCIRFSSLGHEPLFYGKDEIVAASNGQTAQLGKIRLKSNLSLGEITVTARKKNLVISSTGYSIDIKNSYLSAYGTFDDVIKRIPGIAVSPRGGIEVIGKSNPLFILNGRRLTSTADLERLAPGDIKTIHVDRHPGPEYDASYDAVVRVETVDYNREFYSVDWRSGFEYGRRPSYNSKAIIQRKDKKITYGLDAQYNVSNYRQFDSEDKSLWENTDVISTHRDAVLRGHVKTLLLTPSGQLTINEHNKIELIYRFSHNDYNLDSRQEYQSSVSGGKTSIDTHLKQQEIKNSHNPSLFYVYEKNNHSLRVSTDYYAMRTKDYQKVDESYLNDGHTYVNDQRFIDKYEIVGGAVDYKTAIGAWQVSSGAKLSGIKDDGTYKTNDNSQSTSLLNDDTYGIYIGLSNKISSFSFSTALRTEWNTIDYRNSSYETPVKSDFLNMFPSATVKYADDNISTVLSYNKRIKRPTFRELNPNKSYIDPLSYIVGNPLLKSSISDELSLTVNYSNLLFITAYRVRHNDLAGIIDFAPENKIAYANLNLPEMKQMDFVTTYSYTSKWVKSNFFLHARLQDIHFQNLSYSTFGDMPEIMCSVNMDFSVWKNGSFNVRGFYIRNWKLNVVKMRNTGYATFEFSQTFLKDKLRLLAGLEDAFKTYRSNTWESNLANASIQMDTNADSRYLYVTIQYRFGKMKNAPSSTSIISDEKNRL
jgi:hypothetical protein